MTHSLTVELYIDTNHLRTISLEGKTEEQVRKLEQLIQEAVDTIRSEI